MFILAKRSISLAKAILILIYYKLKARLNSREWYWFKDEYFKNKRVIVVGPASSSMSYMDGEEIDSFDIVVRINKSPHTLLGKEEKLGSRTDVLYHCCDEDPITGGGEIKLGLLNDQKTAFLIYTYDDCRVKYNFYRAILKYPEVSFYRTGGHLYKNLRKRYRSKMPSTGLQALNHLMACNFKELHITGFTFFKTSYADGYRDQFKSADKAASLAASSGNHDPDDELRLFKEIYDSHRLQKNIILDSELCRLLLGN